MKNGKTCNKEQNISTAKLKPKPSQNNHVPPHWPKPIKGTLEYFYIAETLPADQKRYRDNRDYTNRMLSIEAQAAKIIREAQGYIQRIHHPITEEYSRTRRGY